jgi:hypothetical protein
MNESTRKSSSNQRRSRLKLAGGGEHGVDAIAIAGTDFLALVGVKPSTQDQRVLTGEAAFALRCEQPAHTGKYLYLDAVAMILAGMINCFTGLELKRAADAVREHWNDWLKLLTKAERFAPPKHAEQFICVAWTSLDPPLRPRARPKKVGRIFGPRRWISAVPDWR